MNLRTTHRSVGAKGRGWPSFRIAAISLLLAFPSLVCAQSQNEYILRAAYLFNLAKYVEWPDPNGDLKIGFVGEGPMGDALEKVLVGKTLGARTIRVWTSPSNEALEQCNVVYVARSSPQKSRAVLEKLRGRNILTIGETDSFTREGGIVSLIRVGDQMHIEISLEAARAAQLKVSSRLLNLSSVIVTDGKN